MEAGYPLKITERWRGIPNNIDSAMTYKDGKLHIFLERIYFIISIFRSNLLLQGQKFLAV